MQVIFTKGTQRYGQLRCVRMDGSATQTQMPEQGIAPHDMIHYVVEKRLHIQGAFFSQIRAGADISFTLEHNEISRAIADKTEVWQTESIVETLQSLLWSGETPTYDGFIYLLEQACSSRDLAVPTVNQTDFDHILNEIMDLSVEWQGMGEGQSLTLKF
ncbi:MULTISPECIES: cytoplasmic protein [Shewanella]|uniref:cytoplasmic protein n=1 Tax=Shewanella TaxID=22 RepID=UPI0021DABDAE|nr:MULTISPECIES: cytoplasmic protein [unclassified Shewanella]MCU7986600.1 cytoplasmic protein [Shewanella sp. SW24]MCU8073802.1 cytoplasmic protein [Shewanella sp. SM29]MCU8087432.1 cytoplasmic protein [Shewanella sp. SM21]